MHGDMYQQNFIKKKKNREWVEFGLQTIVCQPLGWREDTITKVKVCKTLNEH